jgi:hypothetical protein
MWKKHKNFTFKQKNQYSPLKYFEMDISIFTDKAQKPDIADLMQPLAETYPLWIKIREFVLEKYPTGLEEWNFPGAKYGWSFRIKDKKRAIVYFLPRDGFFKVAFVFGSKAMNKILASDISEIIKTDLQNARVYAEGRGIQIEVIDDSNLTDIKKLIEIKLA